MGLCDLKLLSLKKALWYRVFFYHEKAVYRFGLVMDFKWGSELSLKLWWTLYKRGCGLCVGVMVVLVIMGSSRAEEIFHSFDDVPPYTFSRYLGDFEILWREHHLSVRHKDDPYFFAPAAGVPLVRPVSYKERYGKKHVTMRLRPRRVRFAHLQGAWTLISSEKNSLTLRIAYGGVCEGTLFVRFTMVGQPSLDVRVWTDERKVRKRVRGVKSCRGLQLSWRVHPAESLLGLGVQYTHLDLKGHRFTSLSQEQGHGRGLQPLTWVSNHLGRGTGGDETTSYYYVPHMISQRGWSFWLYTKRYTFFDGSKKGRFSVTSTKKSMHFRLNKAPSPKELLGLFADQFGVTKPLPQWVHRGAMMGLQGGEELVREKVRLLLDQQASVSSVWIQDWTGSFQTFLGQRLKWNWFFDDESYPHWRDMVEDFRRDDIVTLSYFNPRLTAKKCPRPCQVDMAHSRDYLVKDARGRPIFLGNGGFNFAMLDFTLPEARDWFGQIIRHHIHHSGVRGWMADFSEALPFHARMSNGVLGKHFHNAYIYEWAKLNGEIIDEIEDGFVFMRAGALGSHKYVHAFWLGDQLTSWDHFDGLKSTLTALISSGLSGALVNHSDIGGLTSLRIPLIANIRRSKELFLRWMQLNAFTPIFRTHEGLWPWDAHQFDSDGETLEQFVRYSEIFSALFSYRKKLVEETQKWGWPMVRGMFLEFPDDDTAWRLDDQFMLGSDLIVAPILEPSGSQRDVYLPQGSWVHIFSQERYDIDVPRFVRVFAGAHEIPVFAKAGTAVERQMARLLSFE